MHFRISIKIIILSVAILITQSNALASQNIDSVLKTAFENSFKAKELRHRVEKAKIKYNDINSLYLPDISINYSYGHYKSESDYGYKTNEQDGFRNRYNISLKMPVYDFGKRHNKKSSEKLKMDSSKYACAANLKGLSEEVLDKLKALLKAKTEQKFYSAIISIAEQKANNATRLYNAGKSSREKVISLKREIAEYRAEMLLYMQEIEENELDLELLTGISNLSKIIEIPEYELKSPETFSIDIESQPEIKYYKSISSSNNYMAKSVRHNWMPNINFEMYYSSYDMNSDNSDNQLENKNEAFAGVSINIPLFNKGKSINDQKKYLQEKYESDLSKAKQKETLRISHKKTVNELKNMSDFITIQKTQEELAKENLENQQRLYKEGLTKKESVLNAEEKHIKSLKQNFATTVLMSQSLT